jgi:tetratricopeptide (TPR) repeat protein
VVLAFGVGLLACPPPTRYVLVPPSSAQALSLLGDTLWAVPVAPEEGQRRVQQLFQAREQLADKPANLNAMLLVARRTAELGRLREAVGLYTRAMEVHPKDPRAYRRRGQLLLTIRELDLAVTDLQKAGQYALGDTSSEFTDLPDGTGFVRSTLQYGIRFQLGLTYYLKGDYVRATQVLAESLKEATTDDDAVSSALWLFFSLRRQERLREAGDALGAVPSGAEVVVREPELRLLLAFRGELTLDSLLRSMQRDSGTADDALYGYGIGMAMLVRGRMEEAELAFEQVLAIPDWTLPAFMAAEAELARIRKRGP